MNNEKTIIDYKFTFYKDNAECVTMTFAAKSFEAASMRADKYLGVSKIYDRWYCPQGKIKNESGNNPKWTKAVYLQKIKDAGNDISNWDKEVKINMAQINFLEVRNKSLLRKKAKASTYINMLKEKVKFIFKH